MFMHSVFYILFLTVQTSNFKMVIKIHRIIVSGVLSYSLLRNSYSARSLTGYFKLQQNK
jgi:hypothetical protein